MFKFKGIYLFPLLTLFLLLIFPKDDIFAAQMEVGNFSLDKVSIVEDDLYISGDSVVIDGVVDGDLIVIGEDITVGGTVTGDIYLFGTDIKVEGNIYGNTIVAGSTVNILGTLKENVYLATMTADLDGTFNKDILAVSGTFKVNGTVGDDVRVASGQVISNASVGGDFLIAGDNYSVEEDGIHGELISGSKKIFQQEKEREFSFSKKDYLGFNIGLALVNFLGMYIVGVILILSAPVKTLQFEKKIIGSWEELLKSYAVGLVILFTIPIPLFLLTISLVGAPLALLILGMLIFLSMFGTVWVESAIGQKILKLSKRDDSGRLLSLFVGRGVSVIVRLIPFLREIYSLSLIFVTIGAVFRTKYDAFMKSKEVGKKEKKVKK